MLLRSFKETSSRRPHAAPECKLPAPAEVWKTTGTPSKVYLTRTCETHGESTACIASDARFYWLAKGDPANACGAVVPVRGSGGDRRDPGAQCRGDRSGRGGAVHLPGADRDRGTPAICLPNLLRGLAVGAAGERLKFHSLESLQERIRGVIARKGKLEILQLSGGEPTLHPQFFELLDWIHAEPGIDYCLVNTNGVRIAKRRLPHGTGRTGAGAGTSSSTCSTTARRRAGQRELRGTDLRDMKHTVMERCEREGIPFTLGDDRNRNNLRTCGIRSAMDCASRSAAGCPSSRCSAADAGAGTRARNR